MKNENHDDFELFYEELPSTDYLNDIEIQDEYDTNDYDKVQGLSDEQVRNIQGDSQTAAHQENQPGPMFEQKLFPQDHLIG